MDRASPAQGAVADVELLTALLMAVSDEDEDVRTQSARLLLALCVSSVPGGTRPVDAARFAAAGAADACGAALQRSVADENADPEEAPRLRRLREAVGE
jgi:hypothetical protein